MSPEAQRIAIGMALGARWFQSNNGSILFRFPDRNHGLVPCEGPLPDCSNPKYMLVPDYGTDLNAMYGAWLSLSGNQKSQFAIALHDIVRRDGCGNYYVNPEDPSWIFESYLVNATAAQRAEAFLKTLDLWEDSK